MPQIPLGEVNQQIRGGQAVEAIDSRDEGMLGRAISNLGRAIGQLKQENKDATYQAAAEVYEQRARAEMVKARQEFSADPNQTDFQQFFKQRLSPIDAEIKSQFGIGEEVGWIAARTRKENDLIPQALVEEQREFAERRKMLGEVMLNAQADKVFNAQDPIAAFQEQLKRNELDVRSKVDRGQTLAEMAPVELVNKNLVLLAQVNNKLESQDRYSEAIELLNQNSGMMDPEKYTKELTRLRSAKSTFENNKRQAEERKEKAEQEMLEKRGMAFATEFILEKIDAAGNPLKLISLEKKMDDAMKNPANGFTAKMRQQVNNADTSISDAQDRAMSQDINTRIGLGQTTYREEIQKLSDPKTPGSLEFKDKMIEKLARLEIRRKELGEERFFRRETRASEKLETAVVNEVATMVRNTQFAQLNPKAADQIIAEVEADIAAKRAANPSRIITAKEIERSVQEAARRRNINLNTEQMRSMRPPTPAEENKIRLEIQDIRQKLKQKDLDENVKQDLLRRGRNLQNNLNQLQREKGAR